MRLTGLELTNIDELNLTAVVMIGAGCPRLQHLKIAHCHYTAEQNDRRRLEAAVAAAKSTAGPAGNAPFRELTSATFLLSSSTHLPLLKYPMVWAKQLVHLTISQGSQFHSQRGCVKLQTFGASPLLTLEIFLPSPVITF